MRISDWSSDVCSSDLPVQTAVDGVDGFLQGLRLEDVAKAEGEPPADALHARFVTADGLDVGLLVWQHNDAPWGRFTVTFDQAQAIKHASEREAFERAAAKAAATGESNDKARSEERREGKSVSVRGDLGGSRISKKNTLKKKKPTKIETK